MRLRIGVDIGGTFTDLVLFDENTSRIHTLKVPTTTDFASGVYQSIEKVTSNLSINPKNIFYIAHATTIVTNMIIKKEGARTALITTKGFEDLLEFGRMRRPDPYDLFYKVPPPLVPRRFIFAVSERINAKGKVIKKLDLNDIDPIIKKVKTNNVNSIAVAFLFSFLNPIHENLIKRILREKLPDIEISLSSDIIPEFREYERISTTLINAYTLPTVRQYLNGFEKSLEKLGIESSLYIMNSTGGLITSKIAKNKSVHLIESGPAAGVIAASYIGTQINEPNLLSFDIGGTTAKIGLIKNFKPEVSPDFEVGGMAHGGRVIKGSGYPIKLPVIDLAEIGQGGGSIAWVDEGGLLQVGPKSAEATPGPACYGKGGQQPTLTDAYIVLGIINPDNFLGGQIKLYPHLALKAINQQISKNLKIDNIAAAQGIIDISNANMIRGLKVVTTKRGYDPREFTLLAFGGAGPLCCGEIAKEVGIRKIIIPEFSGTLSALGLLTTNIRHDYVITFLAKLKQIDLNLLNKSFLKLQTIAKNTLKQEGISSESQIFFKSADLRYAGQSYELEIPVPNDEINHHKLNNFIKMFIEEHNRVYNHSLQEEIEIVNLRLKATGILSKPIMRKHPKDEQGTKKALKYKRRVYLKNFKKFIECDCYDWNRLGPGAIIAGPSVIEKPDSTILIPLEFKGEIDSYRNVFLRT